MLSLSYCNSSSNCCFNPPPLHYWVRQNVRCEGMLLYSIWHGDPCAPNLRLGRHPMWCWRWLPSEQRRGFAGPSSCGPFHFGECAKMWRTDANKCSVSVPGRAHTGITECRNAGFLFDGRQPPLSAPSHATGDFAVSQGRPVK